MKDQKLGFWMATALVMGNMIGSGIFFLPATLGEYGSISILGWLVSAVGALALAFVFIRLTRQYPGVTGGPYIYSRKGFGDTIGYLMGWSYLVSVWLAMASIASAFVGYLGVFLPILNDNFFLSLLTGAGVTLFLTWINIRGLRSGGATQVITTILKITPLIIIIIGGLIFLNPENFKPFNTTGDSVTSILAVTGMLTFFSFLGFECAVIPAGNVRDPERTIPRATLVGTLVTTAIYILATVALIGMLSVDELGQSSAPFADAAVRLWGSNSGYLVSAGIVISTFGALNGWILVSGQIMMAISQDGFFPKVLGKLNRRSAPVNSLLFAFFITTALMIASFSDGMAEAFEFLVSISVATAIIPYTVSASTSIRVILRNTTISAGTRTARLIPAIIGVFFSLWALTSLSSYQLLWTAGLIVLGLPLYYISKNQKR